MEYIVLETDSPYLTPEPYRGKKNEPSFIPLIAAKIAQIKNVDINVVKYVTTSNVSRLIDK